MSEVFTIGYERLSPEALIAMLRASGIERVIDVRAEPRSRRPGFSRGPLGAGMAAAGIDYESVPQAGAPRSIRSLEREPFVAAYRELIGQEGALALVLPLLDRPTALLCREANPGECHRSILAAAVMERTGADVRHLRPSTPFASLPQRPAGWFTATNRHTEDCGEPPVIVAGGIGYTGYFENEFGEQALFRSDGHSFATVQLGDAGWEVKYPVEHGLPGGGLILTSTELAWLNACWDAAGGPKVPGHATRQIGLLGSIRK
jgi:hypothetical protein